MTYDQIPLKIASLSSLESGLFDRDVLLSWKLSDAAIRAILLAAELLEDLTRQGISTRVFDNGLGLSIFRDKSTRTRYAFRAACNLLGLATEELDESTSQISHGETVRETATMIGFLTEAVGIRDDMFLGEGHRFQQEMAASIDDSYQAGVLMQRAAVVNLQSDLDHPTQSMADLRHLAVHFGGLERLRGKKLAMTWAYSPSYGKPLSVPQGIIALMTRFGMDVVLAHPPGYDLVPETMEEARCFAGKSGGRFTLVHSMDEAFQDADIVYPKSWAPMSVMQRRTELLRAGDKPGLAALERDALDNNARFGDWECTDARMAKTRDGKALYMHCLPADVSGVSCAAGEVSAQVFDRYRYDTYREASYKPFVIAAMILVTRFRDPAAVLDRCVQVSPSRRYG
jgi:knotted carbamoyltransferase YgeW